MTLCALLDLAASSEVELLKATSVDQATIRGIVERLKARGLIDLTKDKDNGRKVVISLLSKGEALLYLLRKIGEEDP